MFNSILILQYTFNCSTIYINQCSLKLQHKYIQLTPNISKYVKQRAELVNSQN